MGSLTMPVVGSARTYQIMTGVPAAYWAANKAFNSLTDVINGTAAAAIFSPETAKCSYEIPPVDEFIKCEQTIVLIAPFLSITDEK